MKKKGLIVTFLMLCFLLTYTPAEAVGNCDCGADGYAEVHVSYYPWYNTAQSIMCNCETSAKFVPNHQDNRRCTCGGGGE